jgi:hypothetical protein
VAEKIELGSVVTDSVTGFEGIVTARAEYVTGCNQLLVQPRVKKNGDFVESRWFDEPRCVVKGKRMLGIVRDALAGGDRPAPRR